MDKPERFPYPVIFLSQKSNHPENDHLIQNKKREPANHKEVVFSTSVNGRDLVAQEEEVDIDRHKGEQKQPNNELRALVFTPRNLFFKLRIKNSRTSLQMPGILFISNDGTRTGLVYQVRDNVRVR